MYMYIVHVYSYCEKSFPPREKGMEVVMKIVGEEEEGEKEEEEVGVWGGGVRYTCTCTCK